MADNDLPNEDQEREDLDEIEDVDELDEDLDEDLSIESDEDEFEEDDEIDDGSTDEDGDGDGDGKGDDDDHDSETAEALEELESQELQLLDEEANEALLVDEVAEMRAMRREELTLNVEAQSQKDDEFVCQSCFMVKRTSQLANKRKMICFDCVD